MNRRGRKFWIAVAIVMAVAAPLVWSYYASQHVPEFYEQALRVEPREQRVACTEMFNNTMALVQNVRRRGRWQAEFTQPQINGWLAVDLVENHADLLDDSVSDPRVSLAADRATLAYRYESTALSTVVSVAFDVYLAEPNLVAVRIVRVRAGNLPVPLKQVLKTITDAAVEGGWQIEWRQQGGDPVALVRVPEIRDEDNADRRLYLDKIQIRDGSVYLAGHTEIMDSLQSSREHLPHIRLRLAEQRGVESRR